MKATPLVSVLAALLLVLLPLFAGCLTIPGPETVKKSAADTVTLAISHATEVTPGRTTKALVETPSPAPAITTQEAGYESRTCTQQKGTVVTPGQQCKGTWLAATDTFSCCSVLPVAAGSGNEPVTVAPLSLDVNLDDSLGSITP